MIPRAVSLVPALCLALVACNKREPKPSEAGAQASGASTAQATERDADEQPPASTPPRTLIDQAPPPALALEPVTGPGPAYIAVGGRNDGLVILDERGFRRIDEDEHTSLGHFALARDGTLWAGGVSGLHRVRGERLEAVDMTGAPEGFTAMAVDPAGRVWVQGYEALGRHDEQGWVTHSYADIDPGLEHACSIAADAEGRILFTAMRALYVWDGARWQAERFEGLFERDPLFGALATSVDGTRVVLATSDGTLERTAQGWRRIDWDLGLADTDHLRIAADGRVVQPSIRTQVALASEAGAELLQLAELGVRGQDIDDLFLDASGRLWLATDNGLEILDAEGELTAYPPATVPELGYIEALFVLGSGPDALPRAGAMRTGALTGRLVIAGEAVKGAQIELCPSPDLMYRGSSPCDGKALRFTTTTDDDGRFRFDEVATTRLGFAFRLGDQWQLSLGPSCCEQLEPGGVLDLGDVSFDARD